MGSSIGACALLLIVVMANLNNSSGTTSGGGGYGGVNPDGTTYGGSYNIDDSGAHITSRHGAPAPGAFQPDFPIPTHPNTDDMVRRSQEQAEAIHKQVQENLNRAFENNREYQHRAFEASQNAFRDAQNNYPGAGVYGAGAGGYGGGAGGFGGEAGGHGSGAGYGFGSHGSGSSGSFGPTLDSRGAFASSAIGPGGTRQTASVYPNNPTIPNVDVSSGPANSNGGGGFYSVSSSSFSKSSDIGGKKSHEQGAKTVVNDNGKVTTHEVHNP